MKNQADPIIELSMTEISGVNGGARLQAARLLWNYSKAGLEATYKAGKELGRALTRTTADTTNE